MDKSRKKDGTKCDKATDKKLNACTLPKSGLISL